MTDANGFSPPSQNAAHSTPALDTTPIHVDDRDPSKPRPRSRSTSSFGTVSTTWSARTPPPRYESDWENNTYPESDYTPSSRWSSRSGRSSRRSSFSAPYSVRSSRRSSISHPYEPEEEEIAEKPTRRQERRQCPWLPCRGRRKVDYAPELEDEKNTPCRRKWKFARHLLFRGFITTFLVYVLIYGFVGYKEYSRELGYAPSDGVRVKGATYEYNAPRAGVLTFHQPPELGGIGEVVVGSEDIDGVRVSVSSFGRGAPELTVQEFHSVDGALELTLARKAPWKVLGLNSTAKMSTGEASTKISITLPHSLETVRIETDTYGITHDSAHLPGNLTLASREGSIRAILIADTGASSLSISTVSGNITAFSSLDLAGCGKTKADGVARARVVSESGTVRTQLQYDEQVVKSVTGDVTGVFSGRKGEFTGREVAVKVGGSWRGVVEVMAETMNVFGGGMRAGTARTVVGRESGRRLKVSGGSVVVVSDMEEEVETELKG